MLLVWTTSPLYSLEARLGSLLSIRCQYVETTICRSGQQGAMLASVQMLGLLLAVASSACFRDGKASFRSSPRSVPLTGYLRTLRLKP